MHGSPQGEAPVEEYSPPSPLPPPRMGWMGVDALESCVGVWTTELSGAVSAPWVPTKPSEAM